MIAGNAQLIIKFITDRRHFFRDSHLHIWYITQIHIIYDR